MKVVINCCFGGFTLSKKALDELAPFFKYQNVYAYSFTCSVDRADHDLVRVVEKLGDEANGAYAQLRVIEVPDGTDYIICDYDGKEHIAERHRVWTYEE